ncbi:MAG: 2,3-bisphosphoglycerate-dependent phosphoglycerate mutase [Candidatus Woesearchaeota archaeon]
MVYLVLLRHGESKWNLQNKFTGWVDVPLSEIGLHEALIAAENLKKLKIDIAFTSKLTRAQQTLMMVLTNQEKTAIIIHESEKRKKWAKHKGCADEELPVYESEKLNERYYGALQGLNKEDARAKYGEKKVFEWRRSYDINPPKGESLKDVYKRTIPYFQKKIIPHLKKGKNIIIAAHGNSLRAIIKHIEKIPDTEISKLELATGKPIIYEYKKGKIENTHKHTFNRPIHWESPKKKIKKNKNHDKEIQR